MKIRILTLALVLVFVQVLVFAATVQAVTITWTTTGDFDGGTKSQPTPADGNYEVETNTDNLGIAAGSFELTSLKGDSFTLADTDADTFKWNLLTSGAHTATREMTGGVLRLSDVDGGVAFGVVSATTISGNWDLRVLLDVGPTASGQYELFAVNQAARCGTGTGTEDGFGIIVVAVATFFTFTCVNGAFTNLGSIILSEPICLRILRSGDDFTSYYDATPPCDSWTQAHTTNNINILNPMFAEIYQGQGTNGDGDWDDFYVAAGTVDSGGFRTSGTWTSATQTYSVEVPTQITITYSGASATNYIDAVRIVDSAGATIFTDDTDRTSGTSAVSTVPFSGGLQQNWAVRILLAGGGAGTPTLEAVSVDTAEPPGGSEPPPKGFPGFTISCSPQLNLLRCVLGFPPPAPAGIQILETQWYVDGSFQGRGRALDSQRQEIELTGSWQLAIYKGTANVTVLILLSNGQELRQSRILDVDNSWVAFLLIVGSVAGISLVLLRMMGRLEIRRKRVQDRKDRRSKGKEANWRWQLFEKK